MQMAYDLFAIPTISFQYKCNFRKICYTIVTLKSNLNRENI